MRAVLLVLFLTLFLPAAALCAGNDPDGVELPEYVVTATATPAPTRDVPVKVQVITSEDMERSGATDISDVLARYVPGHFHKYGEDYSTMGLRGFRTNAFGSDMKSRTLVLIDGMRAGTGRINVLSLDNVERIEVVKGPGSVIYGGSAMGGVVNIITRKGRGDISGKIGAEYGTRDHYRLHGQAEGAKDDDLLGFSVGAHIESQNDFMDGHGNTIENSDMTDAGVSASLSLRPSPGQEGNLVAMLDRSRKGSPGARTMPSSTDESENTYARLALDYGQKAGPDTWGWKASAYAVDYEWNWNRGETVNDTFTGGAKGLLDIPTGEFGMLTTGVEYGRITEDQEGTVYNPNTRYDTYAGLAEQKLELGDFTLYLGGRYDYYRLSMSAAPSVSVTDADTRSFSHLSWRGGAVYDATDWLALRAAVGTGFRAPAANELAGTYTASGMTFTGNPDLKAETSTTYETGADLYFDNINAGVTLFYTRSDDTIVSTGSWPNYSYDNIDGMDLMGLEGTINAKYETSLLDTSLLFKPYLNWTSYLHRKNRDEDSVRDNGTDIPLYVSDVSATAGLSTYLGKRWIHDLSMTYTGDQKVSYGNGTHKDGFFVWATRLTFKPTERVSTYLNVENLFDHSYSYVDNYPMPGRSIQVGMEYSF
ncbi:TonB-dependent receptor plug domain-containing protein [Salidesulfovibrio onnuriiensis]|uniref:TonB-dependent receptor plug domain-containing protein n=1 Tax=Salidesulfovibrio onnuriiensis TaxID=2583823 RepID=UPI00164FD80B|nr:TonB-dependent receptor [Salidesulfovibrio onnuriiensis]